MLKNDGLASPPIYAFHGETPSDSRDFERPRLTTTAVQRRACAQPSHAEKVRRERSVRFSTSGRIRLSWIWAGLKKWSVDIAIEREPEGGEKKRCLLLRD